MGNSVSAVLFIAVGAIVIVTAVILLLRSTPSPTNNVPTKNPGSLTQPCSFDVSHQTPNVLGSTGICQNGFICEINQVCVADLGTVCNTIADCSGEATTCSGRCSNQPNGHLNQLCPCNTGLDCVPQSTGFNVCKGGFGFPCVNNSDCVGLCTNGFCSGGLPIGSSCESQICAPPNLYCDPLHFCQEIGIISFQQNAFCQVLSEPGCSPGLACIDNRCASTFGILGKNCSGSVCNLPLVCTTIPPIPGGGIPNNIQACTFIPNNVCINDCPGHFTCVGHKCLGSTGQACIANSNCQSNVCSTMQGLLMWTGTTWNNIATPINDTFSKMMLGVHVDNQIPNVYFLGTQGVWKYSQGIWTLIQGINTTQGSIIDFTITDVTEAPHYLLKKIVGSDYITVVVDGTLTPITNFGTPNGELIIGTQHIKIATIAFTTFGDIYSDDILGNIYKNKTLLGSFGTKVRTYTATTETANNFMYIASNGVISNGEFSIFGDVTFPIFPIPAVGGLRYNIISDYDIFVDYTTDPVSHQTIPNSSTSFFYGIASSDGINYQIILNTSNIQSTIPGYVNAQSLIAINSADLILYSPGVCN